MSEPIVVYANTASVQVGPFDIVVELGRKRDRKSGGVAPGDVDCTVYMSPQHFKAFAGLLNRALEEYEKANGPIAIDQKVKVG